MTEKMLRFFDKIERDDLFTQAGALSYSTALSLAPMVILLIYFFSVMRFDLQTEFLNETRNLIGPEASKVFEAIINGAKSRPDLSVAAGWAGFLVLVFSASIVFIQLQTALNVIFGAPLKKDHHKPSNWHILKKFIFRRLLSVGVLLALLIISIISLSLTAVFSYLVDRYEFVGVQIIAELLNLAIFSVLFGTLYKWMPDRSVRRSHSWLSGIFTSVMFVLGKAAIGAYIGKAAIGSAYGAAGSLIVLLVWIYYSALVFLLGAEISSFFLKPKAHAKH